MKWPSGETATPLHCCLTELNQVLSGLVRGLPRTAFLASCTTESPSTRESQLVRLPGLSCLQRWCFCIAAKASYRRHLGCTLCTVTMPESASAPKCWGRLSPQLCAVHQTAWLPARLYGC